MFRLSTVSLANRSVVGLLTIILTVAGLISLGSLKQELLPSFEVPQASIVTTYPGASPEVVDAQVSSIIDTAASLGTSQDQMNELYRYDSGIGICLEPYIQVDQAVSTGAAIPEVDSQFTECQTFLDSLPQES